MFNVTLSLLIETLKALTKIHKIHRIKRGESIQALLSLLYRHLARTGCGSMLMLSFCHVRQMASGATNLQCMTKTIRHQLPLTPITTATPPSFPLASGIMPTGYKHTDATKKAMVRGTISYLEAQGLPVNKSAIFRHFGVTRSQGYSAMVVPASQRNDPSWEETRGRPAKLSAEDQDKMERVLWEPRYETVCLNWTTLAREAGVESECNARTIHRAMGTLGYRICLLCRSNNVGLKIREKRVEYARRMLELRPQPLDWRPVRFSGEVHFGFGLGGQVRIVPKPGEAFCVGCKEEGVNWGRDVRRVHAWAAVGYGFKSDLVFYDDATGPGSTGTMSMDDYKSKILDKVVRPWLDDDTGSFVLEEDADSFAHGAASKVNAVQAWKAANGLETQFCCSESPDLNLLDAVWQQQPGKRWTRESGEEGERKSEDWEDERLRQAAREAWDGIEMERVNLWVEFMPARLKAVVDEKGKIVTW